MSEAAGVIGKGIRVKGDVTGEGGLIVEGELEGRVQLDRLTIQPGAVVNADLQVEQAIIHGQATGTIEAQDRVEVKATAQVHGDVRAGSIVVEEGATFRGQIQMDVGISDDV